MNNEINKSHEEILDRIFFKPESRDWYKPVLKAMAEVAGLRDKEVEDIQKQSGKTSANLLKEKDKEIEQLKAKISEMSAFVNPLKEGWEGNEG